MKTDKPFLPERGEAARRPSEAGLNHDLNLPKAICVLLVEDSVPVRRRLRSLIEEAGPVEIVGETGRVGTALALFHAHRPDVVVLDLSLEDGDGCTVLTEVKRTRPACVVIVLTMFAIPECREFCFKLGADYFFDKAREFERLPEVLAQWSRAQGGGKI